MDKPESLSHSPAPSARPDQTFAQCAPGGSGGGAPDRDRPSGDLRVEHNTDIAKVQEWLGHAIFLPRECMTSGGIGRKIARYFGWNLILLCQIRTQAIDLEQI